MKKNIELGLQPSDEDVKKYMSKLDTNANGRVDIVEFLRLVGEQRKQYEATHQQTQKQEKEQNIVDAWSALGGNKDKSGKVDANRMKVLLSTMGVGFDVDQGLKELDADHSGAVEFEEFATMMRQKTEKFKL